MTINQNLTTLRTDSVAMMSLDIVLLWLFLCTIPTAFGQAFSSSSTASETAARQPTSSPFATSTKETWPDVYEVTVCSPKTTKQDLTLVGSGGRIECMFSIGGRKNRSLIWRIRPSLPDHGVVLQFHHYNTSYLVDFTVHGGDRGAGASSSFTEEEEYSVSLAPIPLAHREAMIKIKSTACPRCFMSNDPFSFNVSYSAHPVQEMPVPSSLKPVTEVALMAKVTYNCSSPYSVPKGLKCDLVQQCVDGEDEPSTCPYNTIGCERGWISYDDQCLKLVFMDKADQQCLDMVSPRQLCRTNFNADHAVFPNQDGRQLVNTLYRRTGRTPDLYTRVSLGLAKVRPVSDRLSHLYRFIWQWGGAGGPVAFQEVVFQRLATSSDCAALFIYDETASLQSHACTMYDSEAYVCMKPNHNLLSSDDEIDLAGLFLPPASRFVRGFQTKTCADGSVVQTFHPCPLDDRNSVEAWTVQGIPLFPCTIGYGVHYTLVCDGKRDCVDGSDEINCASVKLSFLLDEYFVCTQMQTIPLSSQCNGVKDCFDNSDEERCEFCNGNMVRCSGVGCVPRNHSMMLEPCDVDDAYGTKRSAASVVNFSPPAVVELDGFGFSYLRPLAGNESCPETHFKCKDGYYIPTYLLNNGEQDCLHGEDERMVKENFTCPGFYRCYQTGSCVHADYVCDGVYHCPYKDDEQYCNPSTQKASVPNSGAVDPRTVGPTALDTACPSNCICEGHAFTCGEMFQPRQYLQVRYLDVSRSGNIELTDIHVMPFLHFFNLSSCGLTNVAFANMPLLKVLDLRCNDIRGFENINLKALPGLSYLDISDNPVTADLGYTFTSFVKLAGMTALKTLTMRNIGLQFINSSVFAHLHELQSLDLRNNPIVSFDKDLFSGLANLQVLLADDARLCCDLFHQETRLVECSAPADELSSCSDLLRSDFLRVCLWVMSVLALTGNAGVLVYRLVLNQEQTSVAYRVLIINLSLADLLMGIYMAVIGAADAHFRGDYVSKGADWQQSEVCRMAGVIAFVSSEVSAFAICLITLDRLLALRFPFGSRLRLKKVSCIAACVATWVIGLLLAAVPLINPDWKFYEQTGICIPLPITRQEFPGHEYSLAIFIFLNLILFAWIGVGQAMIFTTVRGSARATKQDNRQKEMTIARRLFLVVLTDFCCWFPISLMGVLAYRGTPIPGVVNVWAAIFVLPLNSALNPFLYTLNMLRERRVKARQRQNVEKMAANLHAELRMWPRDEVESLVRYCLKAGLVGRTTALQWIDPVALQNDDKSVKVCTGTDADRSDKGKTVCEESSSTTVTPVTEQPSL